MLHKVEKSAIENMSSDLVARLPQSLKLNALMNFFLHFTPPIGAAPFDIEKISKMLILAFEVIVQSLVHTLFIALFLLFYPDVHNCVSTFM